MMATWFQGPAGKFIEVSRDGWERGVNILHFLGGGRVTVAGDRAIAQTKMTIMQRGVVHDVLCDVACTGRFYDFMERRGSRWAIVLRQPIYEKDRIDPVDPAAVLALDRARAASSGTPSEPVPTAATTAGGTSTSRSVPPVSPPRSRTVMRSSTGY